MLRDRDNVIGILFVIVVVVIGAILMRAIVTGERITMDLPPAVSAILGIAFFALLIFGLGRSGMLGRWFGGRGGRRWPDPQTGGKSLWDRLRGK